MNTAPRFDAGLLARYDHAAPRYTSYPTAPNFQSAFGETQFRDALVRSNQSPSRPLSAYIHVPFCASPCFYCGCNRVITRDEDRSRPYLQRLSREIELVACEVGRDRELRQVHFGGGTPNFFTTGQLRETLDILRRNFRLANAAHRDFSIELDPRWVGAGDMAALAAAGFNRVSFGVQDLDADVQRAINRVQSTEQTLRAIREARESGFRSVNVDLIYGLPKQTPERFMRTLDTLIQARPDRLAVYGYAHLPNLFKAQRRIAADALPTPQTKLQLLQIAIERLSETGYRYIGMDHFALPEDELSRAQEEGSLSRNFMGYTTHRGCDLIGFGVSAISQVADTFSQNARDLREWESMLDAGCLPVKRGIRLSHDDAIRAVAIHSLMCRGQIEIGGMEQRFDICFDEYFAAALQVLKPLAEDGLVEITARAIEVTARGRLLLRVVAACFDRYLAPGQSTEAPRYSKVV